MKKLLQIVVFWTFATLFTQAQNPYYDALYLKEKFVANPDSNTFNADNTLYQATQARIKEIYVLDSTYAALMEANGLAPANLLPQIKTLTDVNKPALTVYQTKKDTLLSVLGRYFNTSTTNTLKIDLESNPFFQNIDIKAGNGVARSNGGRNIPTSLIGGLGGMDVTALADGLGKFLADRTKEEINIAFFEKFKLLLSQYPELGTVFPSTVKYLEVVMNHEYSNMLTTLKEAFERDLKALPKNILNLSNLKPTDCKCKGQKQIDCQKRVQMLTDLFKTQEGNAVIAALVVTDAVLANTSAPETIARIAENAAIKSGKTDVANVLKLLAIVSNSLRNRDNTDKWITPKELEKLAEDETAFSLYAGLLYQQIKNENIHIDSVNIWERIDSSASTVTGLRNYLTTTIEDGEVWVNGIKKLRAKDTVTAKDVNDLCITPFRTFFKSASNYGIISPRIPQPGAKTKMVLYVSDQGLEITQNILVKNYPAAVLSTLFMLDSLLETRTYTTRKGAIRIDDEKVDSNTIEQLKVDLRLNASTPTEKKNALESQKSLLRKKQRIELSDILKNNKRESIDSAYKAYRSQYIDSLGNLLDTNKLATKYITDQYLTKMNFKRSFLRYGTFMANVILAKNSDEIKKAIQTVALPPGSASIKKNTNFTITLQAYTGFSGGRETATLKTPTSQGVFLNALSIYAPVGISFNIGLKSHRNPSNKYNAGSLSAMFSVIDVGAIFAYRFKDPGSPLADSVKIRLENIFAPGVNIVYGIPKVPLSVGTGIQWQPSLTRLSNTNATITNQSGVRWQIFLVFDLPMLNLYTSRK